MSIRAVDAVLRSGITPASLRLVAVVMADAFNEKTGRLCVSIRFVAERANVGERQARRSVRSLIEQGFLIVTANAAGGAPGAVPHYRLNLEKLIASGPTGDTHDTPTGDFGDTPTGDMHDRGSEWPTGDVHDTDGGHGSPRRGSWKTETGVADVRRTGLNGIEQGAEPSHASAHVGAPAPRPAPARESDPDPKPELPFGPGATPAGLACRAMKAAKVPDVNPSHPTLRKLIDAGVTTEQFADMAAELVGKGKGRFVLVLATLEGRLRDAAAAAAIPAVQRLPWDHDRTTIVAKAAELGMPAWDEYAFSVGRGETFQAYTARVRKAVAAQQVGT